MSERNRFWVRFWSFVGATSAVIGIVVFFTGKNLPDWFPPSTPEAPSSASGSDVPSSRPADATPTPSLPAQPGTGQQVPVQPSPEIRAIGLPSSVFDFTSYDNQTRQSYLLSRSEAASTAYAYKYWQDPDSIWLDATASAGGNTAAVVTKIRESTKSAGQRTEEDGLVTCIWDPDSDPNTPMHTEKCFIVDEERNLALVIWTETQSVGDADGARLIQEIWNTMSVSG